MQLRFETEIVTEQKEVRFDETNQYQVTLNGYLVYPMDAEIHIKRFKKGNALGTGKVISLHWNNEQTTIVYELTSLKGVN